MTASGIQDPAGAGFAPRRYLLLWPVVLCFCLMWAELGHLFGFVGAAVLVPLLPDGATWWALPAVVHVVVALLLLAAVLAIGRRCLLGVDPPTTRWGRALAVVLLSLGFYMCLVQFGEMARVVRQVTDFGTIFKAALAVRAGGDPYAATANGYFYPPTLAYLVTGLAWLPVNGASLLFFSFKFAFVAWTLAACRRLVGADGDAGNRAVLFLFGMIFVTARFWMADLRYGNTNSLIMALVITSVVLDLRGRQVAAGLVLAVATSIKLLPGLLVVHFLMTGRRRAVLGFAAGLAVVNLAPLLFGTDAWIRTWRAYLEAGVAGKLGDRLAQPDNQSLWGMLSRTFPAASLAALHRAWALAAVALMTGAAWISFRMRRDHGLLRIGAVSLYPLLGLLISPGSWVVHYTAVLLPMTLLWRLAQARIWPGAAPWILLVATHLVFTVSGWSRATVDAAIRQSWFVLAALLLAGGLAWWVLRAARTQADPGADRLISG